MLVEILDKIKLLVLRSGISENRYTRLYNIATNLEDQRDIELLEEDLNKVVENEWREANRIWNFVSPAQWKNYEVMDITDLTEQKLLNEALLKLKPRIEELIKSWRPRRKKKKSHSRKLEK